MTGLTAYAPIAGAYKAAGGGPAIYPWPRIRGINQLAPQMNAARLTEYNINAVRESMRKDVTWTRQGTTSRYTPTINFTNFDAMILSLPRGCKVVIDIHTYPGLARWDTTSADNPFYHDINFHYNAAAAQRLIAEHYSTWGDVIAGYDVLNEPTVPCRPSNRGGTPYPKIVSDPLDIPTAQFRQSMVDAWNARTIDYTEPNKNPWLWANDGYPELHLGDRDPRSIENLWELCVAAIREVDRVHPIIIHNAGKGGGKPPPQGTGINQGTYTPPIVNIGNLVMPSDPINNLVAQFHLYEPQEFQTAEPPAGPYPGNLPGTQGNTGGPSIYWDKARLSLLFQPVREFAAANPKVGIFVGEFAPKPMTLSTNFARTAPSGDYGAGILRAGADVFQRHLLELFEDGAWSWCRHTIADNLGKSDAVLNPALFAVLLEFYALNPRLG